MRAFRLWRGLRQLVVGHTTASSSHPYAHLQGSASSLPQRIILHIPFRGSCHRHSTCQSSRILCCRLIVMLEEWLTSSMYRALNINNLCREQYSVFRFIFLRLWMVCDLAESNDLWIWTQRPWNHIIALPSRCFHECSTIHNFFKVRNEMRPDPVKQTLDSDSATPKTYRNVYLVWWTRPSFRVVV